LCADATHAVASGSRSTPQLAYFDVDGYPLAYQEAGEGAALLLVHGSLIDYRAWALQVPAFAAAHRTIAVSLRHCYPERWNGVGGDFTVSRHADDLAAFIAGRKLGPVHLVGHSRGGAVAIALALRNPALVRSLILADPGGLEALLPDTLEGSQMAGESVRMFARLRDDLATGDPWCAARAFVDSLGGAGTWERRTPEQRQMLMDNIGTGPTCAERPRWTREDLAALKGPILLVTGVRSPRRYPLMLAELERCNARVTGCVSIAEAAHAMNRENPAAFNETVLRFLAGQRS
jgi:pimeloyl-ACP methyl ester carboxylesterase